MIPLQFAVDITRCQRSNDGTAIAIALQDKASGLQVVRVEMTLEDFAACVTGQGHMPARVDRLISPAAFANIGRSREMERVYIPRPRTYGADERRAEIRQTIADSAQCQELIAAGWKLDDDGVGTQQNGREWHVSFVRYVEPA